MLCFSHHCFLPIAISYLPVIFLWRIVDNSFKRHFSVAFMDQREGTEMQESNADIIQDRRTSPPAYDLDDISRENAQAVAAPGVASLADDDPQHANGGLEPQLLRRRNAPRGAETLALDPVLEKLIMVIICLFCLLIGYGGCHVADRMKGKYPITAFYRQWAEHGVETMVFYDQKGTGLIHTRSLEVC